MLSRKILIDLAGLFFLGLVVFLGYRFSPLLLPPADLTVQPNAACNLHQQACAVSLPDGGEMTLSITPRPIPLMSPFQVQIKVSGMLAERIEIDFSGIEMNMGLNRFSLHDQGSGIFVAEASIPICVTGQMEWQANVMLSSGRQRISVPFRFTSGRSAQ